MQITKKISKTKVMQLTYLGFTLIEVIIVVTIIGILATISVVSYGGLTKNTGVVSLKSDLDHAASQLASDLFVDGSYPATEAAANGGKGLPKSPDTIYQYYALDKGYCLTAKSQKPNLESFYISSSVSSIQEGPCFGAESVVAWGGVEEEKPYSIIKTRDGGYAVTGSTYSYGDDYYGDMFIAKYGVDNSLSWIRSWSWNRVDYGNSIIQTRDGGYAVTGVTTRSGANDFDMFIAKYAANGSLSWSQTWGGINEDSGNSITQTSDGGYAVTGSTAIPGAGARDMFIAKYAANGSLSWSQTWGGANDDSGNSITSTSDDGYAVTGSTASYGAGSSDIFIAKYAANGSLSWDQTWGGVGNETGNSIIQTSDGGYAIAGDCWITGSGFDMIIVKYAANGSLSWKKTWGGSSTDGGKSVIQTSDGGYAVAGIAKSYGDAWGDVYIAKYADDGSLSWDQTWGGDSIEESASIIQIIDDSYVVAGLTYTYGINDYGEMFIAKFSSSGTIAGCVSPMCKDPSATETTPVGTVDNGLIATETNPTANIQNITADDISQSAIKTLILPVPPLMTITFSSQELYVAWPGNDQNVCKSWTVPNGETIKGFMVSQNTEFEYDYFKVSSNGVEKYNQSGYLTNVYVDLTNSPGTTLSACIITDDGYQDGYGGQVTGVLYN